MHVAAMVEYFYCADYATPSASAPAGRSHLETMAIHIGIACLAEMYNVKGLKTLAADKMVASMWPWTFSQKPRLKEALEKVYGASTPEEVREAFVDKAVEVCLTKVTTGRGSANVFKKLGHMHSIRDLGKMLKKWPEFAAFMLEKAVAQQRDRDQWGLKDDSDDDDDEHDSDMSDY